MDISVVVPAYNEEHCLPATLDAIVASLEQSGLDGEVIVVDNDSTDSTADIARRRGAVVVTEQRHNISSVRNCGAKNASGRMLVFVDADTSIPASLVSRISELLSVDGCFGGAVAVTYSDLQRAWTKLYLAGWRFWAHFFSMAQGATQFCRKSDFDRLGGYNIDIFMGEDIEFYWRLSKYAREHGGELTLISDLKVVTSGRRFNKMPVWKTILLTHPVFIRLAWRKPDVWKSWYQHPVR